MATFSRLMQDYESIHKHPINRAIHAIGIPAIMVGVQGLGALAHVPGAPWLNVGSALIAITGFVTLRWSKVAGFAYIVLATSTAFVAAWIAAPLDVAGRALAFGSIFVCGWAVQFIGHAFEGKSPQFVARPANLLLGPISVVAEIAPFIRPKQETDG